MTQTHGGHGQGRSARAEGPHTPVTACTPSAATTGKQQQSATAQDARTICTGTPTVGRITDTLSKQMATQYPSRLVTGTGHAEAHIPAVRGWSSGPRGRIGSGADQVVVDAWGLLGAAEGCALHRPGRRRIIAVMTEGSLAGAVSVCQASGAAGWDLVDQASRVVQERFTTYSVLHVWERPETAFGRRRGYCAQYNGALAQILRRLGFDAWMVYAARVRFDDNPEWSLGHAWVRVRLDGDVRDVCARSASNRPGSVGFVCLGRVRRLGLVARVAAGGGTAAAAFAAVLLARFRGQGRPRWVEHARAGS